MDVNQFIRKKFNRLTIIGVNHTKQLLCKNGSKNGIKYYVDCECECGTKKVLNIYNVISGHTKSCGCLQKEKQYEGHFRHGLVTNKLYGTWCRIKNRCLNTKLKDYKNYGGRGITVCNEWKNDFIPFYNWAITNGYNDKLSIDRINNDGNYEPSNCRWATHKQQSNNRRSNKYFTYQNITKNYKEWCEYLDINYKTFYARLSRGRSIQEALELG